VIHFEDPDEQRPGTAVSEGVQAGTEDDVLPDPARNRQGERILGDPAAGDLGEVTFMLGCEIRRATKCQSTLAATLSMQIMQRWGAKLFGSPPRLPAIGQLEERISWATTIFREQA